MKYPTCEKHVRAKTFRWNRWRCAECERERNRKRDATDDRKQWRRSYQYMTGGRRNYLAQTRRQLTKQFEIMLAGELEFTTYGEPFWCEKAMTEWRKQNDRRRREFDEQVRQLKEGAVTVQELVNQVIREQGRWSGGRGLVKKCHDDFRKAFAHLLTEGVRSGL